MACALGGAGSRTRQLTVLHEEACFPSPHLSAGPPPPVGHLRRTHTHLLQGGTCSRRVSIAGPMVHLRANDVEKQQVHGHSRAGCRPFFKVFFEFVTILLLFSVLVFWARGLWDLSFPDQGLNLYSPHWKVKS